MSGIDQLLTVARAYAAATELELSTVSWRVFGDTKKLGALEDGADIQTRRYELAIRWFSDNWPKATKWPKGIDRPEKAQAKAVR